MGCPGSTISPDSSVIEEFTGQGQMLRDKTLRGEFSTVGVHEEFSVIQRLSL